MKKKLLLMLVIVLFYGCSSINDLTQKIEKKSVENFSETTTGVIVFYDAEDKKYWVSNEELVNKRWAPCSTFKIVSTLAALEYEVISDENAKMGYDGQIHEIATWNADLNLNAAFQASCVWYYKKLIAQLGKKPMQTFLNKLDYGNCNISVWNDNGHNVFWIESSLQISAKEQVRALENIFESGDFKEKNLSILQNCMNLGKVGDLEFFGKTGTGRNHNTHFLEGWFVGFFINENGKKIYFASHLADSKRNIFGAEAREVIKRIIPEIKDLAKNNEIILKKSGS